MIDTFAAMISSSRVCWASPIIGTNPAQQPRQCLFVGGAATPLYESGLADSERWWAPTTLRHAQCGTTSDLHEAIISPLLNQYAEHFEKSRIAVTNSSSRAGSASFTVLAMD
ncbi:MAG: hypothetical protein ACRDRO_21085 [Pseudonocardiaceae bacterium]